MCSTGLRSEVSNVQWSHKALEIKGRSGESGEGEVIGMYQNHWKVGRVVKQSGEVKG